MAEREQRHIKHENELLDKVLKLALATPPISNEDILKRSKESHRK